jgi:hypothetical protein
MSQPAAGPQATPASTPVHPAVASAARWFWWIAGLSVVNTAIAASGGAMNFVVGLGITAVADAVFRQQPATGYAVDAVAVAFFFGMGYFALRGRLWAFYVGAAVYVLDGLIYLRYQDWMPVAFHALALYFIIRGAMALRAASA